jgi:hypothetical protein
MELNEKTSEGTRDGCYTDRLASEGLTQKLLSKLLRAKRVAMGVQEQWQGQGGPPANATA